MTNGTDCLPGVALTILLAATACGGKTALEIDSLPARSSSGGTGSRTSRPGIGGATTLATTIASGRGGAVSTAGSGSGLATTGGQLGATSGSTVSLGGKAGESRTGAESGNGPNPICPDEVRDGVAPFTIEGNLKEYANKYVPTCAYSSSVPDFTLVWQVTEPDMYVIDTFGSEVDTAVGAYNGACGSAELACDDDDGTFSKQSRVALEVTSPSVVTLVVDGPPGPFRLNVARASSLVDVVLPSNLPIQTNGATVNKTNRATSTCNGKTPSNDMFFLFKAPASGTYQFLVESTSFDAVLSLRDGGPAGDEVTCNDDFVGDNPGLYYALRAGQSVAIVVDGFQGAKGFFNLYVTQDSTDSGDCCSASNTRGGCTDASVMQCVCKQRHDCCYHYWDSSCVAVVDQLGCGMCGTT